MHESVTGKECQRANKLLIISNYTKIQECEASRVLYASGTNGTVYKLRGHAWGLGTKGVSSARLDNSTHFHKDSLNTLFYLER